MAVGISLDGWNSTAWYARNKKKLNNKETPRGRCSEAFFAMTAGDHGIPDISYIIEGMIK